MWAAGRRLDAASLGELNPHKSAELIRAMNHDDAVLLLATADIDAATPALDVLLKMDEALAVAILADISRRRAEALIAVVTANAARREWLRDLPEAAAAIGNRAAELRLTTPGPFEHLHRASPWLRHAGYRRAYKNGQIYWSRPLSAAPRTVAITDVILDHYVRSGEWRGAIGLPEDDERPVRGTAGRRWVQVFRGGVIYRHETSVIEVGRAVAAYLFAFADGLHRYPLGPEVLTPQSPSGVGGMMQRFGGSCDSLDETVYYASSVIKPCGVRGDIASYYHQLGGPSSWLGFPTARQTYLEGRPIQDFECGTVFIGPDHPLAVPAASMELIWRDEGMKERIGFPVTAEEQTGTSDDRWQFFQNGVVTVKDGNRQVWVRP
jgi:uncharacterized protein with LGFP repeats